MHVSRLLPPRPLSNRLYNPYVVVAYLRGPLDNSRCSRHETIDVFIGTRVAIVLIMNTTNRRSIKEVAHTLVASPSNQEDLLQVVGTIKTWYPGVKLTVECGEVHVRGIGRALLSELRDVAREAV